MKNKKKWWLILALLVLAALLGVLFPSGMVIQDYSLISWRYCLDVNCNSFGFADDSRSCFFLWRNDTFPSYYIYYVAKLYCYGDSKCFMGCCCL
jgi:hypothetical protein